MKRRGCFQWSAVTLIVLVVLALVAAGVYGVLRLRQQQLQAQFMPPSVTITYPDSGTSNLEGSYLPVSATAFGTTPITRAELWLDDELVATQESPSAEGVSPFYVTFDLTVPLGLHTIFVRAVDANGLMGDSWPVNVGGVERPGPEDPAVLVTVQEGETVEDISAEYDVDPDTVRELNPGLGDEEPPAGSEMVLPPPRSSFPSVPGGPSVGPTLPGGGDQPPGGSPPTLPMGEWLDILPADPPISMAPLLDLVMAGSPPAAPTDLQAEVMGCDVRLSWKDNADNEDRYQVWYLWQRGQDPRIVAELEPAGGGQVSFEFIAPSWGAYYFWVEAVNPWGSQPSNRDMALVSEEDCPDPDPTHFQVELLDITVPGGYDRTYCYLSVLGARHVRVPAEGFFEDLVGPAVGADTLTLETSGVKRVVPAGNGAPGWPNIDVECWGWSGGRLREIGSARFAPGPRVWGEPYVSEGRGLTVTVNASPLVQELDTSGQTTTYSYDDPSMPVPYDVFEHRVRSFNPVDPLMRAVVWKWDGDPSTISGFQILLNGVPYSSGGGWSLVDSTGRSVQVMLPTDCGQHIRWQVRAVAGQAQSGLSALTPDNDYDLPQCPEYVMVKFNAFQVDQDCDTYPAWFLELNGQVKQFHDSCDTGPFEGCMIRGGRLPDCGWHHFSELGAGMDPHPDTIVVPLSPGDIKAEVKVAVWDRMSGDMLAAFWQPRYFSSFEEAQQEVGCGLEGFVLGAPHWCRLDYTLYIFPQPAGMDCPVSNPAYLP
jgi:hypothetical protein